MTTLEKIFYLITNTLLIIVGCHLLVEGFKSDIQKLDIYLRIRKQPIVEDEIYKLEPKREKK